MNKVNGSGATIFGVPKYPYDSSCDPSKTIKTFLIGKYTTAAQIVKVSIHAL